MRRVHVNGFTTLMDYCTGPSFASGGFIADSRFDGSTIVNGSQQQFLVRNSTVDGWSNGVWNQVFAGDVGAPAQCFPPDGCTGPYTTLATTPANREKPYLYVDGSGKYQVFVPAATTNSVGESWASGATPGRSIPVSDFLLRNRPTPSRRSITSSRRAGTPLLTLAHNVDRTSRSPGRTVARLGPATPTPANETSHDGRRRSGVDIAGLIFFAGPVNSPTLLQIGTQHASNGAAAEQRLATC
jgi:hypothetical protein